MVIVCFFVSVSYISSVYVCCIYSVYVLYLLFVYMYVRMYVCISYVYKILNVCVLLQCGRTAFAEHWSLK